MVSTFYFCVCKISCPNFGCPSFSLDIPLRKAISQVLINIPTFIDSAKERVKHLSTLKIRVDLPTLIPLISQGKEKGQTFR